MKYLVTVSFTQCKELTIYAQSEAEAEEKAVDIVLKWANVEDAEAERDKWRELAREASHAAGWLVKCDDHRPLFAGMTPEGWLAKFKELEL